ncbi:hypothetical protein CUMW_168800 [Citrus unshiu]|uniref:Uncharacterized protein n=1 Tax=Citrus unshiu TaxID=55188 RepID=A0A2H5PUJ2_CITUN|nr:hypothetical protein CUMW_168800 [Citrus unshiu]
MFEAVVAALGLPRALPTNTPSIPCILDNRGRLVYVVDGCWLKFRVCCLKWLALAEHLVNNIHVMIRFIYLLLCFAVSGGSWLRRKNGTRMIGPQPLIFGHAAQFITVNDYRFHPSVNGWLERGLVRPWGGMIGELETSEVNVMRPCWIGNLDPFN